MRRILAIAVLIALCLPLAASARALEVLVVEVKDGKTIIVENSGRRVKVVLKGADAPELDQPSGETARQHLANLILGKEAAVEFTGMAERSHFIARVFLKETDISLQMIRDGAAWYDRSGGNSLSAAERSLYAESEQAARSECRGIWQDPKPTPPWEWRQAKAANHENGLVAATSTVRKSKAIKSGDSKNWPFLSLPNAPFSVRMPGISYQEVIEVQVPQGEKISVNFYWTRHLKIEYVAVWANGPYYPGAVPAIFDRTLESLNRYSANHGLLCEFKKEKDAALNGYRGERYKVEGCYYYGGLRLYYKVEGKTLRLCLVGVMSEVPEDPLIKEFLQSFVIHNGSPG